MFACIYIPDFSVEAIMRAEPILCGRAMAVLEGKPPLTRVFALNERARLLGLEAGMTKLQAALFAETDACKDPVMTLPNSARTFAAKQAKTAVLRQRSRMQENSAHLAMLDVAYSFTPRVEDTAMDTLLLELSGFERLYGSAATMAGDLAARVAAVGVTANIALAMNPHAALHAARGFNGVTVLAAGQEAKRLGVLPVQILLDAFPITSREQAGKSPHGEADKQRAQMLDTLERWGVRDFRTLSLLPEHALGSRLGQAGVQLRKLALGQGMRTLSLSEPPSRFEEAMELEFPVETVESLSFLLNRLLEQLCVRLEARALAVQELQLRLELDCRVSDEQSTTVEELRRTSGESDNVAHPSSSERNLRLPVSMRDSKVFLKLLQLDLAASPPGAPVKKISITAEPAPPRSAQRGLFLPITPEAEKLEITLARIKAVIGERRAGIARLLDTNRPQGFQMERFAIPNSRPDGNQCQTMSDMAESSALAMRIIRPPQRLQVCLLDGRPSSLSSGKKRVSRGELQGKVLWSAGPWRSSGEWWSEHAKADDLSAAQSGPWDREEWDIALLCMPKLQDSAEGTEENKVAVYRIYQDVASGDWFADAIYD